MNTYDPATLHEKPEKKKKKKKPQNYGFVMFLAVFAILLGILLFANMKEGAASHPQQDAGGQYTDRYISILEVHGTMSGDGSDEAYSQSWLLDNIDYLMDDPYNCGLMLSINTPGGEVYAVDELYLKIREYQETTGRPVYAYMEAMAASGGYYIAAPADKIYANRNCWTGSIGVTAGTVVDASEFLEKHGIKTVTITAGKNKAMGSMTEPLSNEQKDIYQSLVDEAYDQFVGIVAEGRNMKLEKVKKLADGRIYTANQAKENGLIDEIGTRDEALAAMKKDCKLDDAYHEVLRYEPEFRLSSLFQVVTQLVGKSEAKTEYQYMMEIMGQNGTFTVTYLSEIRK